MIVFYTDRDKYVDERKILFRLAYSHAIIFKIK